MVSRPDRAWRIADGRFPIFDGTGAFLFGARWNSPGRRIIYASETYTGAILETLVHTRIGKIPTHQAGIEITIPAHVSIEELRAEDLKGWDALDSGVARRFGDEWLRQGRTAVLVVPSLVTSGLTRNVLINQGHPEFTRITASKPKAVVWDARLFQTHGIQRRKPD